MSQRAKRAEPQADTTERMSIHDDHIFIERAIANYDREIEEVPSSVA
jgi:hypothetical protein